MESGAKIWLCLLGCFALTLGVRAAEADADSNPYAAIVQRNVFDLKPPPVVTTNDVPAVPPPNVKLTGITTILGNKRALFMVQEAALPGKPPGKPESVILAEGQRQGGLEVLDINTITSIVKIRNDGEVSQITFDASKTPTGPAASAGINPGLNPGLEPGFNPRANRGYNQAGNSWGGNNGVPGRRSTVLPPRGPYRPPPQ